MKNNDDKKMSLDEKSAVIKNTNRVFARMLSRPLSERETNQVSGGLGTSPSELGRWYWTDNGKFRALDWGPN